MTVRTLDDGIKQAKALAAANNHEAASVLLDELLHDHSQEPEFWAARAYVSAHKQDYQAAEHDMGRAISLEEMEPDYFFTRGRYRSMSKRFMEAVADFTRTIELSDHHGSDYYRELALLLRAEAYLALGMVDLARADCKHIRDETVGWAGSVRSKADILADCDRKT